MSPLQAVLSFLGLDLGAAKSAQALLSTSFAVVGGGGSYFRDFQIIISSFTQIYFGLIFCTYILKL